jgi:hypothetical protein
VAIRSRERRPFGEERKAESVMNKKRKRPGGLINI